MLPWLQPPGPHVAFATALTLLVASLAIGCEAERFALRPTVTQEHDDVPFHRRPATRPHDRVSDAVDLVALRPASTALSLDFGGNARNVNALEEVPDSTWFTNRIVSPERAAIGPCQGVAMPVAPFAVLERKGEGTTPGILVRDAAGRHWLLKVDTHAGDRPETSTASDAIGTRIYWTLGYNTPCNYVIETPRAGISLDPQAFERNDIGQHVRFPRVDLESILDLAVHDGRGNIRLSASSLLRGDIIGPWSGMGTRADDPNDAVPHEDRRELRGERWLAAWLNHWDAREVNTLDVFERAGGDGAGVVRHYFVDWGDAIGGRTVQRARAQSLGWLTMVTVPIGEQPWRAARIDPDAPNLGYFGASPFDPMRWQAIFPLPRFDRADDGDFAWMARRIARIGHEHIANIVTQGRFTHPYVSSHLVAILEARRMTLLRTAFARRSPLADFTVEDGRFCAVDLAVRTGVSEESALQFAATVREGTDTHAQALPVDAQGDRVCVELPAAHVEDVRDGDPARYFVIEVVRDDAPHTTTLRAHLYDLGAQRGYHLAGIERLPGR